MLILLKEDMASISKYYFSHQAFLHYFWNNNLWCKYIKRYQKISNNCVIGNHDNFMGDIQT